MLAYANKLRRHMGLSRTPAPLSGRAGGRQAHHRKRADESFTASIGFPILRLHPRAPQAPQCWCSCALPICAVCVRVSVHCPDSPACRAQVVPLHGRDAPVPLALLVGQIFIFVEGSRPARCAAPSPSPHTAHASATAVIPRCISVPAGRVEQRLSLFLYG